LLRRGGFVGAWLAYGTHVDEARKILYVETPKAACTTVKYFLRSLVCRRPLRFHGGTVATRMDMLIHDRSQSPLLSLADLPPERAEEIVADESWFRFCVVRHPIDRFFAAWRDKVFLCEPEYERYLPGDGRRFVEFGDFLERVLREDKPETCDLHWRAQTALLMPALINYTSVYAVQALGKMRADLGEHLQRQGMRAQLPDLVRRNEGLAIRQDGFLTAERIAALRAFYDADFRVFGFPEMTPVDSPTAMAADLVNEYTDAIFYRNRMLAAHSLGVIK
jgi:hypothetical protein